MTHNERIAAMLAKTAGKATKENNWGARHCAAFREPQATELGIVRMIEGAAAYADQHNRRFDSALGEDYVLGPQWESIIQAVRALLNGESGRLDCGTVDGLLCDMLRAEGFKVE